MIECAVHAASLPDLPLTEDDRKILELLAAEPLSHALHCFNSAIDHLRRAHALKTLDPAMAIFRGITAEEEAASGLMHALRDRAYPKSDLLRPRDHIQKHAVVPFLRFLLHNLAEVRLTGVASVRLAMKEVNGTRRLVVVILQAGDVASDAIVPVPPLNLSLSAGPFGGFPDLGRNIQLLLRSSGYTNALSYLQAEANTRNRILYAGPSGYPVVGDLQPEFLIERQRRVFTILKAALLILPYADVQPFAADALNAFLRLVRRLDRTSPNKALPTSGHSEVKLNTAPSKS